MLAVDEKGVHLPGRLDSTRRRCQPIFNYESSLGKLETLWPPEVDDEAV